MLDSERVFQQTVDSEKYEDSLLNVDTNAAIPNISKTINGNINSDIRILSTTNQVVINNRALIGKAIDILEADNLLGADLSFSIHNFTESIENLIIAYYDYDTNELVPVETKFDLENNVIASKIEKLGTYCVINVSTLLRQLGYEIVKPKTEDAIMPTSIIEPIEDTTSNESGYSGKTIQEIMELNGYSSDDSGYIEEQFESVLRALPKAGGPKGVADIAFVIDTTGSMGDEISNVVKNINAFTDKLATEYNVDVNYALVEYKDIVADGEDSTIVHNQNGSNWFTSSESFKNKMLSLRVSGGGDRPESVIDALETARRLDYRATSEKFVILLTDADYKTENRYGIENTSELIDKYINDDISISVITSSYYKDLYSEFYLSTDGVYGNIYGNFLVELLKLADRIGDKVSDGTWITLSDFTVVKLEQVPTEGSSVDSDGDNLSDCDELVSCTPTMYDLTSWIKSKLISQGIDSSELSGKTSIPVYSYYSNPALKDTDGDGYSDYDEKVRGSNAKRYDITERTLSLVAGISYNNLRDYIGKTIGEVVSLGYSFTNISKNGLEILKDWRIIYANDSVESDKYGWDYGLGSLALYKKISGKETILFGLRGSEFSDDLLNDALTDALGAFSLSTFQSPFASVEYTTIASVYKKADIYVAGHSLGGRLTQDVVKSAYMGSMFYNRPVHATTFNGFGYTYKNYMSMIFLDLAIVSDKSLTNYYYAHDLVGSFLGRSTSFVRLGTQKGPYEAKDEYGNKILGDFFIGYSFAEVHGINLWHYDERLNSLSLENLN